MIIHTLEGCAAYAGIHPVVGPVLAGLSGLRLQDFSSGRHSLDGDTVYVVVTEGPGKRADEAKLETHRTYVDIHVVIQGDDTVGWKPASACSRISTPYDAERDFTLFDDPPDLWLTFQPGLVGVFFPDDAHAPLVSQGIVRKAVVKVAMHGQKGATAWT